MRRLAALALLLVLALSAAPSWAQGPIYIPNSVGPAGPTGPPGDDGINGLQGPPGPQGDAGTDGTDAQPLLQMVSPSGASSVQISDFVDPGYFKYKIELQLTLSADDKELFFRTDADDGASIDAGATDYAFAGSSLDPSGPASNSSSGADAIDLIEDGTGQAIGGASGESVAGTITIEHLGGASTFPIISWNLHYINANGLPTTSTGTGARLANGAISAFALIPETGATLTGDVKLYGIRAN